MSHAHPAKPIHWVDVESSNVAKVGWDDAANMFVTYRNGGVYMYRGVSRQRAVAAAHAASAGRYISQRIIPEFDAVKL